MHIIFVTTQLATKNISSGGLATFTANIARVFHRHGHKVGVFLVSTKEQKVTFDEGIYIKNIFVDKYEWDEYDFISKLYFPLKKEKSDINRKEIVEIRKMQLVKQEIDEINKKEKVDIVHFCNHGAYSLLMGNKIPYTIRISGYLNICTGGADTPKGSVEFSDNPLAIRDQLEFHAMQKIKHVISPSKLLADIGRRNIDINPSVLESPFVLAENDWDYTIVKNKLHDKKYILFFGVLRYLKGIQIIADIVERFLENKKDMYFVLSGLDMGVKDDDGSPITAIDYIKKKSGHYVDRVIYLGRLIREQLYPVVQHAELCILPSRIENLSNSCIEAMALGRIVVATEGASYEQLIEDGKNGYLCERDNADSFLHKIEMILTLNDKEKESIRENAKKTVERLNPENIYNQYLVYYQKVIREWDT